MVLEDVLIFFLDVTFFLEIFYGFGGCSRNFVKLMGFSLRFGACFVIVWVSSMGSVLLCFLCCSLAVLRLNRKRKTMVLPCD